MKLSIVHLYPQEMNIYGDTGNRLVIQKRLEWRGFEPEIKLVGVGDKIPNDADFILGGGGQDAGQDLVVADLASKKIQLQNLAKDGVTMLMICGMYQLFGHYFLTSAGKKLQGIGVFDAVTNGSDTRLIGNINIQTHFGELVGYENHSGLTQLGSGQEPLGSTKKGQGNNGQDMTEGAIAGNVFGSYLHGPILAKNPNLADELIKRVLKRQGITKELQQLDDNLEHQAARIAKTRPR